MTLKKIKGLILTGGKSSRMGEDKALINYHGKTQAKYLFDLMKPFCDEVYLSARPKQWDDSDISDLPQLLDMEISRGPTRGILTALKTDPTVSWLVVACDLIHINEQSLQTLVENFNPQVTAICFANREKHFPEALCALYTPQALDVFLAAAENDMSCPVKILSHANILKLEQVEGIDLTNINTPDERSKAINSSTKKITINYFAILRDHAGKNSETLETSCANYRELYSKLKEQYDFSLSECMIQVAVNDEFTTLEAPIVSGAKVVFIPPVAGG